MIELTSVIILRDLITSSIINCDKTAPHCIILLMNDKLPFSVFWLGKNICLKAETQRSVSSCDSVHRTRVGVVCTIWKASLCVLEWQGSTAVTFSSRYVCLSVGGGLIFDDVSFRKNSSFAARVPEAKLLISCSTAHRRLHV